VHGSVIGTEESGAVGAEHGSVDPFGIATQPSPIAVN